LVGLPKKVEKPELKPLKRLAQHLFSSKTIGAHIIVDISMPGYPWISIVLIFTLIARSIRTPHITPKQSEQPLILLACFFLLSILWHQAQKMVASIYGRFSRSLIDEVTYVPSAPCLSRAHRP
jgi:hypothetical protein